MIQFAFILILLFSLPGFVWAQDITTGLVGHWKFDEGSGTTAADSSGNNNTGTLINGPTWTLAPSNGGDGKIGGAVSFDGITQYVNSGSNTILDNLPALSFSAWINPSTATYGPQGTVVQKGHGGISLLYEGWILAFLANNPTQLGFQSKHQTTDLLVVAQPNTFTMNE